MFIHLGNRKVVSDREIIGIFNIETLKQSNINDFILGAVEPGSKTAAISENNTIYFSAVSPFTVIKRKTIETDFVWRKNNEQ